MASITDALILVAAFINISLFVTQLVLVFFTNDYLLLGDSFYSLIDGLLLLSPFILRITLKGCESKCQNNKIFKLFFSLFINGFSVGYRVLLIIVVVIEFIGSQTPLKQFLYSMVIGWIGFVANFLAFLLLEGAERLTDDEGDESILEALIYCLLPDAISSMFIGIFGTLNYTLKNTNSTNTTSIETSIEYSNLSVTIVLSIVFGLLSLKLFFKSMFKLKSKIAITCHEKKEL